MKKTATDTAAVAANMGELKRLKKFGSDLMEYWGRLLPGISPSTEDYRQWAGDPGYIYQRYREIQLENGMTAQVFDSLPIETRQPELDDPRPIFNPLQVTRHGEGGTHSSGPERSKFTPGRYARTAQLAGQVKTSRDGHPIIVSPEWLEMRRGQLEIVKDAEKRLTAHFTHVFTPEQVAVGETVEALTAGLQKVLALTGGRLPITQEGELDINALKRI